ncbi:MAG: Rieske 2Fe-2S domain-containing protein [Actinomycetota bacterium]|nr:Rieske 2Fe-2S domain-containing protein [Actinomycetota bacterium]
MLRAAVAVAALAAGGLVATWWSGGRPQLEATLAAVCLGALCFGLLSWARRRAPAELDAEPRQPSLPEMSVERRRFLTRVLAGVAAAAGLASVFPFVSELRHTGRDLGRTAWREGRRVVTQDGRGVRAGDLGVGGLLTVYPEGRTDDADSQVVLIRLEPGQIVASPGRDEWTPEDHVAYSKLCTHMGCPVGLYQQRTHVLLCPCHQAAFDVLRGARPLIGPATRPLPQLPLVLDGRGYLRAAGDFSDDVGPGHWNRPK